MLEYRGLKENVGWWFTLLLIGHLTLPIPIILLYAWWKYAQVFQEFAGGDNKSALRTFAMFCLLPPLAWATVQSEINRRANRAPVKPLIFDRSFGYAFVCPIAGALGGALVGLAVALIIGGELAEIGQIKLWPDFSAADDADVLAAVWPLTSIFTGALFGALLGTFMGARAVHQSGSSRIWRGLAVGVLVCAAIATSGAFTFMVYLEQVPHPFGF